MLTQTPASAVSSGAPANILNIAIGAACAISLMAPLMLIGILSRTSLSIGETGVGGVSSRAEAEIPARYLALYRKAAARYGLDWSILAGIGKVECDHGRNPAPSCTREGMVNSAGAGGPAQFLASTWNTYGIDGDGDGRIDRWDPDDAIFAMANFLHAAGAPSDYRKAIFAYNHAGWYVRKVEHWASLYRSAAQRRINGYAASAAVNWSGVGPVQYTAGARAVLSRGDGHLALIPAQVPPAVQAMVIAGNELQNLPYGPSGHPDPRGAYNEDCSSTINYVLYRSGLRPIAEIVRSNPLARDYMQWGDPGPGRWVTIYATTAPTEHVFIVIAGLRLDTSHHGTDMGPNRNQDGPRWRVLQGIPTWAHWSVRHPPGL